jgi:mRNA-degrading endonuclease RelE of RelBE toxin-antitoxin system
LRELAADPHAHAKPMKGGGGRLSSRVGEYRIVFRLDQAAGRINVLAIGPRGRVYRDL